MDRKTSQFALDLKSVGENGFFAGYASVFDVRDNHNDIILPGAFAASLRCRSNGAEIKLLWQHRSDEPVGVISKLSEDAHGLYVEGRLLFDVQRAREAYALMKNGAVRGLSIGFIVKRYEHDALGARVISEADLWEISLVTFPANEAARVISVRSNGSYAELESSVEHAINILTKQ